MYQEYVRTHPDHRSADALPEAQYRLAEAYLGDSRTPEARTAFEEVAADYPDSPWAEEAKTRVASLAATGVGFEGKIGWPHP